jgi:hypothetical protein
MRVKTWVSWSLSKNLPQKGGKVWLLVRLYHFVMPHKSLRQGRTPRTPAMAIGLTDHVWSSREYIGLPVHTDPGLTTQMDERIARLLTPALQSQPRGQDTSTLSSAGQPLARGVRADPGAGISGQGGSRVAWGGRTRSVEKTV